MRHCPRSSRDRASSHTRKVIIKKSGRYQQTWSQLFDSHPWRICLAMVRSAFTRLLGSMMTESRFAQFNSSCFVRRSGCVIVPGGIEIGAMMARDYDVLSKAYVREVVRFNINARALSRLPWNEQWRRGALNRLAHYQTARSVNTSRPLFCTQVLVANAVRMPAAVPHYTAAGPAGCPSHCKRPTRFFLPIISPYLCAMIGCDVAIHRSTRALRRHILH
jgi:hypothetical protein